MHKSFNYLWARDNYLWARDTKSGPEKVSLGQIYFLWARLSISGPEIIISGPEIISLAQRYFLWARLSISGPEIIKTFVHSGPYGPHSGPYGPPYNIDCKHSKLIYLRQDIFPTKFFCLGPTGGT